MRQNYVSATKYVCVAGIMKMGESAEETVIREVKGRNRSGRGKLRVISVKAILMRKKKCVMRGYTGAAVKRKSLNFVL
ncbi:MAG: hypothetical protein ACLUR5_03020 [Eubacterium ventriosum]